MTVELTVEKDRKLSNPERDEDVADVFSQFGSACEASRTPTTELKAPRIREGVAGRLWGALGRGVTHDNV